MTANITPKQKLNLESYIILPRKDSEDILVSQQRTDKGLDWYKTHKVLHQEGFFMPTPSQFFDFLDFLKSKRRVYNGKGNSLNPNTRTAILNDILEKRDPWRAEHLDARFFVYNGTMFVAYDYRTIHGELHAVKVEPLEKCVMENCYVDLTRINRQGLPTRKLRTQTYSQGKNICFWSPSDNSIAWFGADSGWVSLGCNRGPRDPDTDLGVRRQKFLEE